MDSITASVDMSLSKLWQTEDREASATVYGVTETQTQLILVYVLLKQALRHNLVNEQGFPLFTIS